MTHSVSGPFRRRSVPSLALDPFERSLFGQDLAVELRLADLVEDRREIRAGLEAEPDQVVSRDQRRRVDGAGRLGGQVIPAVIHVLGIARRRQCVGAMKRQQIIDARLGEDPLELRLAKFLGLAQILMKGDEPGGSLTLEVGKLQVPAQSIADPRTDLFVVVKTVTALDQGARAPA